MIKVTNRSSGEVVYSLPELNNTRRLFSLGETKEISEAELEALWQISGGMEIIKHFLIVQDKDWVKRHWSEVPVEYFWSNDQIKACLLNDSIDLFNETLDYAPEGVLDVIKTYSWTLPLADLNKIEAIKTKLNFDVQAATSFMRPMTDEEVKAPRKERLRKEEV